MRADVGKTKSTLDRYIQLSPGCESVTRDRSGRIGFRGSEVIDRRRREMPASAPAHGAGKRGKVFASCDKETKRQTTNELTLVIMNRTNSRPLDTGRRCIRWSICMDHDK